MGDDVYTMVKNPHGIAYIVFIYEYDYIGPPERKPRTLEGYKMDIENLKCLFYQLHYQVEVLSNPKLEVSTTFIIVLTSYNLRV